ncbi:MAG: LVIVD repeat-containing protein [Armatimonadota bacterium]
MRNPRVALSVAAGLIGMAAIVFYLRIGWLIPEPESVDAARMGYCFDVATDEAGSRLYVAAGTRGLHVLDVVGARLRYVSTYYDDGYYRNVTVHEGWVFVADARRGLVILDARSDSLRTAWVQSSGKAYGIHVENDRAYIAAAEDGLAIFDVSRPNAPVLLGTLGTGGHVWDVWARNGLAYLADMDSGLVVVDVSTPAEPRRVSSASWTARYPTAEIVRGERNTIYIAASRHGLVIVDVSDPTRPAVVARYRPLRVGKAEGLAVRQGTVFLAMGSRAIGLTTINNGLHIIDVSDPQSPSLLGMARFPGWVEGVHVADSMVFVANTYVGVRSIDVREPAEPRIVSSFGEIPRTAVPILPR